MINKKKVLGVGITDATKTEVLEYIVKNLQNFKKKLFIVTPNPEFLVLANKNPQFKNILNKADLALADGMGVMIAAKVMGKPLRERFAGIDLVESLCREVSEKPITVGFLGGRGGVAEKTSECLRKKYPKLKVGFVGEEWLNDSITGPVGLHPRPTSSVAPLPSGARRGSPAPATRSDISSSGATPSINHKVDILFVAFGAPKQEFWINEHLDEIPVKVAIGAGGAFDYISGKVPRAPNLMRSIGLEWLFRLVIQPWRIKRQLSLIKFIGLVMKERFA